MPRLAAIALLLAACSSSGGATAPADPRVALADAFGIPVTDVIEAATVEVNREPVAVMGRFTRGGDSVAAVVSKQDGGKKELGAATELHFNGLLDLAARSTLRAVSRRPVGHKSKGMSRPVLVWFTRHEETVERGPTDMPGSWTGVRQTETLFILGRGLREILRLETERHAPDGFGGFALAPLVIEQREGKTVLTTTRQDRLPASRSRCLRPEPYEMRFELVDGRFRDVSPPPVSSPCH